MAPARDRSRKRGAGSPAGAGELGPPYRQPLLKGPRSNPPAPGLTSAVLGHHATHAGPRAGRGDPSGFEGPPRRYDFPFLRDWGRGLGKGRRRSSARAQR